MTGWIKIWRQLLDWEWADVPEMMALWVRLLLMANNRTTTWHGFIVEAGQLVTTYDQLAALSGLTVKQVRICMARLQDSGQICIKRAGKRQLISISNYKQFQEFEIQKGQENGTEKAGNRADKGQTKGRQSASSINIQEVKNTRSKEDKNNNPQPPLQGAAPEKKPEREKCHAVTRYDSIWEERYKTLTGDDFQWTRRENVAVNAIVGKIVQMMEAAGRDPTNTEKENALLWFIETLYKTGDTWVRSNFTPHVIADKFNEYYQTIKNNSKNGQSKQHTAAANPAGVSADYLARVVQQLAGEVQP